MNLTSYGGLVCVGIHKDWNNLENYEYSDLILWNPLTGEYKKLSKNSSHKGRGEAFELYYSSRDDDYKLLHVTRGPHAYIYSLKSDTWRKIDSMEEFTYKFINWGIKSIALNGKLYFLVKIGGPKHSVMMIKFEIESEKFTVIATPFTTCPSFRFDSMVALKGCILLDCKVLGENYLVTRREWWRMDGDGDWTKVFVSHSNRPFFINCHQQLLHVMRYGTWLMHSERHHCVYELDIKNRTRYRSSSQTPYSIGIYPKEKYVETLVSPNRYMK